MDVRVRGKGFDALSVVDFALDGTIDSTGIRTNSTRYVSSSELVANITIAPTATVTTWDVIVTSKGKTGIGTESDIFEVLDPIISWYAPIGDASLAIAGDGKYPENGYSVYSHKICKVETALFLGGSGDATLSTAPPKGTGCGRTFIFTYPDGVSETLAVFANAVFLHHETSSIPVGTTVRRKFNWNPGVLTTQASGRCGRVVYGQRDAVAVGSDSVEVTRVDSRTWMVQTGGNHLGWCESRNELYRMPFRLMLRSNISLP
jgi:hypothetical protein